MSLTKFISLILTKSLFCTRIDLLGDIHEGSSTKSYFDSDQYMYLDKKDNKETLFQRRQRLRKTMFVNC